MGCPDGEACRSNLSGTTTYVLAVAFSPDGRSRPDRQRRHDRAALGLPPTARPVHQPLLHQGRVVAVAFSPDGRILLTGSDDRNARLWDAAPASSAARPLKHDGPVSVAAFSPDGLTVITGGWDRIARLWETETGSPISQPLRHDGSLRSLAISRDGRTVLTGSYDRTAQLWDKATGKPIGPAFRHENQVWFVAFSPDGLSVLSGGQQRTAHLWKVPALTNSTLEELEDSLQVATGMRAPRRWHPPHHGRPGMERATHEDAGQTRPVNRDVPCHRYQCLARTQPDRLLQ